MFVRRNWTRRNEPGRKRDLPMARAMSAKPQRTGTIFRPNGHVEAVPVKQMSTTCVPAGSPLIRMRVKRVLSCVQRAYH